MLAVLQQAPRMGSSQPPDPFLPFGYAVDPNQEPLPEPPEPAPGNPLLSDNDNTLLSTFFEDIAADHYSMPSFGEGLNFSESWIDLPPQFMGTATSFGQQPGLPLESPNNTMNGFYSAAFQGMLPMAPNSMPPPPHPSLQPQSHPEHAHTPNEVLNAAATLVKNGPAQRQNSVTNDGSFTRRPMGPPVGHLRHQPIEEFKQEGGKGSSTNVHDNTFTEWMFGPQERRNPRNAPPTDVQWGSDSSFNHLQYFTPNSDRETAESLSNEQMKYLECLEPSQSAENTRASSPNPNHMAPPTNTRLPDLVTRQREADAPPRKRRKSRNGKDAPDHDAEAEAEAMASKPVRRKKSKAERSFEPSPPTTEAPTGKRRKSGVNGAKQSRENLSEEQKRENHIKSEQKRRTLIKEGFDGLCGFVPGLRGGGFSKSTMLAMTAEWLDDLLQGNKTLEGQLTALERRTC